MFFGFERKKLMNIIPKKILMWIIPACLCIILLSVGDKTYGAELTAFERDDEAIGADTDGNYVLSDMPYESGEKGRASVIIRLGEEQNTETPAADAGESAAESASSGEAEGGSFEDSLIVTGVHGGPGVSGTPASEETSAESETSDDGDGVYMIDGVAYRKVELIGNFKLTGYCGCSRCGGGQATYSGTTPRAKHTIAADLSVLPIGTKVIIEGTSGPTVHNFDGIYDVEDKGSGVNGNHIDIYFDTHEEARSVTDPGWQYSDVWIAVPVE